MRLRAIHWLLALALAAAPATWAGNDDKELKDKENVEKIGERDVDGGFNFYSIEKDIKIGQQMAAEVERTSKIVDDPVISEYVNRIGQNIVRNSDAKVPFQIKVIDNDEINAFALPGGFFFVNSGLIGAADSEAELAGVMAHEIAHVNARHGTRQATRGQVANLASIPLIFLGGWTGYGIRQAAGLALPMTFLKFSRSFEKEADFLGVQYLYAAGYDPNAMVSFFEKLQAREKRKPGTLSKVFRSHPLNKDRAVRVQALIEELLPQKQEYAVTTSEFQQVKDRVNRLNSTRRSPQDDPDRPTLRRKAPTDSIPPGEDDPDGTGDDDRPTLKRKPAGDTLTQSTSGHNSGI